MTEADHAQIRGAQGAGEGLRQSIGVPVRRRDPGRLLLVIGQRHSGGEQDRQQGTLVLIQLRPGKVAELLDESGSCVGVYTNSVAQ